MPFLCIVLDQKKGVKLERYNFSELAALIEINSYTHNKEGVDKVGALFGQMMEEIGFEQERFVREEIGDHLLFRSPKKGGKRLLLLGHLDTVFPPNSFEGFREDEKWIYGPGVCDMKGGNHVALEALRNLKKRQGGIFDIDMLLVSDEETGSDDSKHLTARLAPEYDYCLVFEAAGKHDEVVIGRKGMGTFSVEITGHAAHAGNDYTKGANANLEAARKLIALTELTDLGRGTTVNVGKMEGGIGPNTISPHARLMVEVRYTHGKERDRVLEALYEIVHRCSVDRVRASLSGGVQRDVLEPDEAQAAFLHWIEEVTGMSIPTERRGGVSDANVVASVGVPVLDGWGPFGDGDHTIHERASKKSYLKRIETVTKILEAFTTRPPA